MIRLYLLQNLKNELIVSNYTPNEIKSQPLFKDELFEVLFTTSNLSSMQLYLNKKVPGIYPNHSVTFMMKEGEVVVDTKDIAGTKIDMSTQQPPVKRSKKPSPRITCPHCDYKCVASIMWRHIRNHHPEV